MSLFVLSLIHAYYIISTKTADFGHFWLIFFGKNKIISKTKLGPYTKIESIGPLNMGTN